MTQEDWLTSHPFLRPVAALHAQVNALAAEVCTSTVRNPIWDSYLDDFLAGMPLLQNSAAAVDLNPAEKMVRLLVQRLASGTLPGKLSEQTQVLQAELRSTSEDSVRVVAWLVEGARFDTSCPGLLRYLGWTAIAHYVSPMVDAFKGWSEKGRWLRTYCPTCGSPPVMAQLVGTEPARTRLLCCGCCGACWPYRRIGCPFCENQDDRHLGVVMIEAEGGLRIDYCECCSAYLKTYSGQGDEDILLADWTSIHLDFLARGRDLNRPAASLYDL